MNRLLGNVDDPNEAELIQNASSLFKAGKYPGSTAVVKVAGR